MEPPSLKTTTQKLVTIYLDNMVYAKGKGFIIGSFAEKHGSVEEHLNTYLNEGWSVVMIHGFGGSSDAAAARGWFAVLLEKTA